MGDGRQAPAQVGDLQEASWVRHAWAPAPALRFAAPTLVTRCEHVMNARLRADVLKIRRVRLKTSDFFFTVGVHSPTPGGAREASEAVESTHLLGAGWRAAEDER